MSALFILIFLLAPAVSIALCKRVSFLSRLGPVVVCYGLGILIGNFPFPLGVQKIAKGVAEISIPLAIPLLLLSTDFVRFRQLAGKTLLGFLLAIFSVFLSSCLGAVLFAKNLAESWKIAGMLVGVYVGGTPNMSAVGLALKVQSETFLLLNAADVLFSSAYLLFLFTAAKRVLARLLPSFEGGKEPSLLPTSDEMEPKWAGAFLLLSFVVLGTTLILSRLTLGGISAPFVVLSVTLAGILGSFVTTLRSRPEAYATGEYLLLIFCVAIGAASSLQQVLTQSGIILSYVAFVLGGAIFLHYSFCGIFRVDRDTAMITSTAAVFGPAFVVPVAQVLGNRQIVVSGLTTGLMGYALGNFLGLATAYMVRALMGIAGS